MTRLKSANQLPHGEQRNGDLYEELAPDTYNVVGYSRKLPFL